MTEPVIAKVRNDAAQRLREVVQPFALAADGVYSPPMPAGLQSTERAFRERVAAKSYSDYLAEISRYHSIPVMDKEVDRFLAKLPAGALILDIGGCWGWHWRRLKPDQNIGVLIVDFVRPNLYHAQQVLGSLVGDRVKLMHADATSLPFSDGTATKGFDAVWTVQAFQHVPDFGLPCREAFRVLRSGGHFLNYSQNAPPFNRFVYAAMRRKLHTAGVVEGAFHFDRATDEQRQLIAQVFGNSVKDRYTEILFQPELRVSFPGRLGSRIGWLDARLSGAPVIGKWFGRQRSFEVTKP